MYDCQSILKLLYPYLDGELDVKESLRVQDHLQNCAYCLALFKQEKQYLDTFKKSASIPSAPSQLREKITVILKHAKSSQPARVIPNRRPFSRYFTPFPVAGLVAIMMVAGGIFFFALSNNISEKKLAKEVEIHLEMVRAAVEHHEALITGKDSFGVVDSNLAYILVYLHQGLDLKLALPEAELSSMQPIGAKLLRVGARNAGIITFKSPEGKVSLFMTDSEELKAVKKDGIMFKRLTFFPAEYRGFYTLAWNVPGKVTYILVSDQKQKLIEACRICHGDDSRYDFGWAKRRI